MITPEPGGAVHGSDGMVSFKGLSALDVYPFRRVGHPITAAHDRAAEPELDGRPLPRQPCFKGPTRWVPVVL